MSWQTTLTDSWLHRGLLARLLWPVSRVYALLQRLHAQTSQSPRPLSCPTIVVGNVVVGGAGKTPLTIALCEALIARGEQPGVVSKGYGRQSHKPLVDVTPQTPASEAGDEPVVMAQALNCPVVVCNERGNGIRHLLAQYPDTTVVLCDDGLQDPHLHRDVEIVVFDERGVGNGWLLPAGPLREHWPRTPAPNVRSLLVQGATAGDNIAPLPGSHGPMWLVWRQLDEYLSPLNGPESIPLTSLVGQSVQALAGIAKPQAFFQMLQAQGLVVEHRVTRPDHDALINVEALLQPNLPLITTAKDAVKLRATLPPELAAHVWVAHLALTLPDSLITALMQAIQIRQSELSSHHG